MARSWPQTAARASSRSHRPIFRRDQGPVNKWGRVRVGSDLVEGERLDEDQIALVIRRASELDGQVLAGQAGLDLVLLEQAAVEAGLSRQSVRRAVAELRAGTLALDPGPGRRSGRARLG